LTLTRGRGDNLSLRIMLRASNSFIARMEVSGGVKEGRNLTFDDHLISWSSVE